MRPRDRPGRPGILRGRVDEHVGQVSGPRPGAPPWSPTRTGPGRPAGRRPPRRPAPEVGDRRRLRTTARPPAPTARRRPQGEHDRGSRDGSPGGGLRARSPLARNPSSTAARRMSDLVRTSRWRWRTWPGHAVEVLLGGGRADVHASRHRIQLQSRCVEAQGGELLDAQVGHVLGDSARMAAMSGVRKPSPEATARIASRSAAGSSRLDM